MNLKSNLAVITISLALTLGANAAHIPVDLNITPATTPQIIGNDSSNFDAAQIQALVGGPALTELYKVNVQGGEESKPFSNNYNTTFSNSPGDPADALIKWDGNAEPFITGYSSLWLYVKDGNQEPAFYLINLAALNWDGQGDLNLTGFWPRQGSISHLAILGGSTEPGLNVPDGGMTLSLVGAALAALGGYARRRKA